jgi:hypothetical protein
VPEAVPVAAARPAPEPIAAPPEPRGPVEPPEQLAPLEPIEPTEPLPLEVWDAEAEPAAAVPRPRLRRPRLLHMWAALVILVGLAFVGATILLSVALRDYTHFGVVPTAVGIGLGLIAVWVGVALARSH